ncbi:MAG: hypothetical protein IPJ65_20345 [Archangiaceae bacterium]|nr:hypothetical protein [Archangiaceae bacterium]
MSTVSHLPARLDQVPAEQQLRESIGLGYGGIGLGSLIVFVGYLLQLVRVGLAGDAWKFAAGSATVAVGGFVLEVLRRRRPLTLVPQGPEVGVYKDGELKGTFPMKQLTLYKLSWANTFRELVLFGVFGAMATLGAVSTLLSGPPGLYTAWVWGVAVALDALAYSSVLTRLMAKQYYLPGGTASGAVAFPKSQLAKVGWNH